VFLKWNISAIIYYTILKPPLPERDVFDICIFCTTVRVTHMVSSYVRVMTATPLLFMTVRIHIPAGYAHPIIHTSPATILHSWQKQLCFIHRITWNYTEKVFISLSKLQRSDKVCIVISSLIHVTCTSY